MSEPLFEIVLDIEGKQHYVGYETVEQCLNDEGLQIIMEQRLSEGCSIQLGNKQIAKLPKALLTWDRFKDQVISNSTKLLRGM